MDCQMREGCPLFKFDLETGTTEPNCDTCPYAITLWLYAKKTELLGETHMRVMVWEARAREAVCSGRGHAAAIRDVYDEAPALLAKLRGA